MLSVADVINLIKHLKGDRELEEKYINEAARKVSY